MNLPLLRSLPVAALATLLVAPAAAHRGWLLPSSTVVSGKDQWVTVDAASSTDVFTADHNAMRLDALQVWAPNGAQAKAENQSTGRYRSVFDVKLDQPGTYKIAMVNDALIASWKVGSETKRGRGTPESLAKEIPSGAQIVSVVQSVSRNEVFVTSGKPSDAVLKPTGRGIELVPVTHPNDLVSGETATFRFVLDGKPAAGLQVTVIPGGVRYRGKLEEQRLVTDAQGEVKVAWAQPGMYWLNAVPARPAGQGGGGQGGAGGAAPGGNAPDAGEEGGPRPVGGTLQAPVRRASYTATFEVLPQ